MSKRINIYEGDSEKHDKELYYMQSNERPRGMFLLSTFEIVNLSRKMPNSKVGEVPMGGNRKLTYYYHIS